MIILSEITIYIENFLVQHHTEPMYTAYMSTWIQSIIGQWLENIQQGLTGLDS